MNIQKAVLTLATTTIGLNAGLFFGYQVSVNPAFKTLSDKEYIIAMQAINDAIQNPVFLLTFMGPAILLPSAVYLSRNTPATPRMKLLIAATTLYILGVLGVTIGRNVPLNNALAAVSLRSATSQQLEAARSAFQEPWNTWHLIRTAASIGSLALAIIACLSEHRLFKSTYNKN